MHGSLKKEQTKETITSQTATTAFLQRTVETVKDLTSGLSFPARGITCYIIAITL